MIASVVALTVVQWATAASFEDAKDAFARKDYVTAAALAERLATSGDRYAQFLLAQLYKHGQGVERNLPRALQWYLQAANNDHRQAQRVLARHCDLGDGIRRNLRLADYWRARSRGEKPRKPWDPAIIEMLEDMRRNIARDIALGR